MGVNTIRTTTCRTCNASRVDSVRGSTSLVLQLTEDMQKVGDLWDNVQAELLGDSTNCESCAAQTLHSHKYKYELLEPCPLLVITLRPPARNAADIAFCA